MTLKMKSIYILIFFTITLLLVSSCSTETIEINELVENIETVEPTESIDFTTSDFTPATGESPNAKPLTEKEEDPGALRLITATSSNGFDWTRTNEEFIDRVGAPEAVIDSEGRIFLYYVSGTEGLENIWVASVSEDQGETWVHKFVNVEGKPEGGKIADTTTILLEDGTFRSYFQSQFPGDKHNFIRSAVSSDGLNFVIEDGIRITELDNGNMAIAPNVLQIEDTIHLYT
ncbi:hypothetical protein HOC96_07125, partial [archaeon]|nr:hypothetical protein [archaeon]